MADNVEVAVGGNASGAIAALSGVKNSIKEVSDQGKAHIDSLTGAFGKLQASMLAIAALAAGGAMFSGMVKSTIDQTSEVTSLQKAFGLTVEKADDLADQFKLLGIKSEDYINMSMRLNRQLRSGDEALTKMGMTAKDIDLGQKGMMDKAIAKLAEYKEGVDRNIAATVLFGRGGAEALNLIKTLAPESAKRAKELSDALGGSITKEDQANAKAYKTAMNELDMAFDAIKKTIGAAVMPYLTAFGNWFVSVAPTIINAFRTSMSTIVATGFQLATGFVNFVSTVISGISELSSGGGLMGVFRSIGQEIDIFVEKLRGAGREIGAIRDWLQGDLVEGWKNWNKVVDENEKSLQKVKDGLAPIGSRVADAFSQSSVENWRVSALKAIADVKTAVDAGQIGPMKPPSTTPQGTKSAAHLLEPDNSKERIARAMLVAKGEVDVAKEALRQKEAILDLEVSMGQRTQNSKFSALAKYSEEAYQLELGLLQKESEISGMTIVQQQQVFNKIKMLKAQHVTEMINIDKQSLQAQLAMWKQYTDTIASSFSAQMRGILTGQTSFSQAMKNILLDLSLKTIELLVTKPLADYVAMQLAKLTATQTGAAAQAAAEIAAAEATLPAKIASFTSDLTSRAALTFAGVFANLAPIMGPLASGPAGVAEAAVMAQGVAVPKYDVGSWSVPKTQLAVVHAGEFIGRAGAEASAARDAVTGGGSGGGGGGGGHTFVIQALDGASVHKWLQGGGAAMIAKATSRYQDKNPSTRGRRS